MGTTWGTEQGCFGSSSWREVVVLAGGGDEEILITAKAEHICLSYLCVCVMSRFPTVTGIDRIHISSSDVEGTPGL